MNHFFKRYVRGITWRLGVFCAVFAFIDRPGFGQAETPVSVQLSRHLYGQDSVPFRFLPYARKLQISEREHSYRESRLSLYEPGTYRFQDIDKGYQISEDYPGILVYTYLGHGAMQEAWGVYRVEIYDNNKNLARYLDIRALSPYTAENYPNLKYGFPDREFVKDPDDESMNCVFNDLPQPDNYYTVSEATVSPGGQFVVEHRLYKLAGNLIVGAENTIVVYDKTGLEAARFKPTFESRYPFVSTDGQYVTYLYGGGQTESPFGRCNAHVEIYDIRQKKIVFHHQFLPSEKVSNIVELEKENFLVIGVGKYSGGYKSGTFLIDIKNKAVYVLNFEQQEWAETVKTFTSYTDLLKHHRYETIKF